MGILLLTFNEEILLVFVNHNEKAHFYFEGRSISCPAKFGKLYYRFEQQF